MPSVSLARVRRVALRLVAATAVLAAPALTVVPVYAEPLVPSEGGSAVAPLPPIDPFEYVGRTNRVPRGGPSAEVAEPVQQAATLAMKPLPLVGFHPQWPALGEITTHFGDIGPTSPHGHSGVDIAAQTGTIIRAADSGVVKQAGWDTGGYGNLVVVEHPAGFETWYGHLSVVSVQSGEQVERGEQIGRMGSTGYSTGPHLHFEVRQDGQLRNPLAFLEP